MNFSLEVRNKLGDVGVISTSLLTKLLSCQVFLASSRRLGRKFTNQKAASVSTQVTVSNKQQVRTKHKNDAAAGFRPDQSVTVLVFVLVPVPVLVRVCRVVRVVRCARVTPCSRGL